ncbi:hypothetical protein BGZ98_007320 [Dissophora globulifera]|nr:hypothetical protein BGZ98_007320 [Dissophora globulifera]
MIKLTRGRHERERKLRIKTRQDAATKPSLSLSPTAVAAATASSLSSSHSSLDDRANLHRLIVRGTNHPQELTHSPAFSFHARFANSLTVTPSSMGLLDDIFTLHYAGIVRCGVLQHMKYSGFHAAPEHGIGQDPRKVFHEPYTEKLQTLKATKFNHPPYGVPPAPDVYVPINEGQNQQNPLCIANKYGYMAMVAQSGDLKVYCTMPGKKPSVIHAGPLQDSSDSSMLSSVEIVRWPRYHTAYRDGVDIHSTENYSETDGNGSDVQEGYPTKPGQFDHYLVIAGSEKGLFIVALPDHPNHGNDDDYPASGYVPDDNNDFGDNNYSDDYSDDGNYTDDDNYSAGGYVSDTDDHEFKFKGDHTWIQHGFNDIPLNDARVSPNGRWIAVVGEDARVWTIAVSHVLETEEQRVVREEQEREIMLESPGTDLDAKYAANDCLSDMEDKLRIEDDEDGPRSKRLPHESNGGAFSDLEEPAAFKNQKRMHAPRLLHQFGHPVEMLIPTELVIQTPPRPCCQYRQPPDGASYSSQNVAWNSASTKFAHSSNTSPRVYVWSVPSRQLVCCVDVGGPSFAIEFHPTLENLFAVANWYGFVLVVDLTGCCIGDKDLDLSDAYYANGEAQEGPGLASCGDPHYEEKHDILMLSFRDENDNSLRILHGIRGLGWSTDGRYLYVATIYRVLQFELADGRVRIPSLFQLCARKVREWKERVDDAQYTFESPWYINKEYRPMPEEWQLVPSFIKRKIWGNMFYMRSHNGERKDRE